jgi:hypothetical protein
MKKSLLLVLLTLALILPTVACGENSQSYSYYEFVCDGSMTVTHQGSSGELSSEDVRTLLGLWGAPWLFGQDHLCFNYEFQWEDTTIRYCSTFGVFELAATGQQMKLSRDDRKTVKELIEHTV